MEAPSDQTSSKTSELMCHDNTSEQLHTIDELPEKTNQIGTEPLDHEQRVISTGETAYIDRKSPSGGVAGNSVIQQPQCDLDKSFRNEESSSLQHNILEQGNVIGMDASSDHMCTETRNSMCRINNNSEQLHTIAPTTAHFEMSNKTNQIGSEILNNEQRVLGTGETSSLIDGKQLTVSNMEQVSGSLSNDESQNRHPQASLDAHNEPVERSGVNEKLETPSLDASMGSSPNHLQRNSKRETHALLGGKDRRTATSRKKKYMLRSSDRVLRSRIREKPIPPEPDTNVVKSEHVGEHRRRGRKKKTNKGRGRWRVTDEYSRIRARLRYFLHRVSYEQNLIDAYSGEGWKGHSLEKLKPEKELQHAKSKILGFKLKIRDLFRHLDTLCAEGRLPQSLFDAEGEICSEDIFCAKCRSKDLTTNNDIILCDGVCDRGFHQFCLEPPLLSENIPPDDEGWLCPGCDCKDDCLDLLNDNFGTGLSICDSWERVFPEAAAGNNVDDTLGLPSDDSDDGDYNPDVAEDKEVEGGDSSSDESENASASEKMKASREKDPYLGLPSEDSEDNDFDPDAVDHDKDVAEESSSSDFTSDSEDLADVVKGNALCGLDNNTVPASSLPELNPGEEDFTPVSGKRNVEKLDYKKLYDEAYGNASSDSSDDDDWTDRPASRRKKKVSSKGLPVSPNGKTSIADHMQNETENTPRSTAGPTNVENMDNSPSKSLEGSKMAGSNGKKRGSSNYKRLGEDTVKVLHKHFKENQYPDRTFKQSLAQELGLTLNQVSKWFENTRWNSRHTPRMEAMASNSVLQDATSSRVENEAAPVDEKGDSKSVPQEEGNNIQKPKPQSSRKRRHNADTEGSDANINIDNAATNAIVHSPSVEVQENQKTKTRKRK